MRDPLSRSFASLHSSTDTWFLRVRENLRQLFTSSPLFPSSANGAPIHLLKLRRNPMSGRASTASLITHLALLCGILLLSIPSHTTKIVGHGDGPGSHTRLAYLPPPDASPFGRPSLGRNGGGGEEDPRPARHGLLAPESSMPLAPPRILQNSHPVLPVPAAVFDANAPEFAKPVSNLGLPWMKENSDSAGPGKNHGIGSGKEGGMGDRNGPGAGWSESENGPYANVVSLPKCAYCPDPQYTDEAREARLQGSVTLMVLVDADGRAAQIRITQGIGLGLDERAVQAIRTWKFVPARDAARRAVPAWVTVETVYRLF